MSAQLKYKLTADDYLALEREAEYKSEFYNGEMFAMAGASEAHVTIVGNLSGELRQKLKDRPCKSYANDMRLRVNATGLYTYPDVIVVCGQRIFADDQKDTLLNPTVIIEVLSDSTKDYDRGGKFAHYRKLDSLQEYILVAQDEAHIEQLVRQPDGSWIFSEINGLGATLRLNSIECEIATAEIFDKVDFPVKSVIFEEREV